MKLFEHFLDNNREFCCKCYHLLNRIFQHEYSKHCCRNLVFTALFNGILGLFQLC